jgi:hypothetical protein
MGEIVPDSYEISVTKTAKTDGAADISPSQAYAALLINTDETGTPTETDSVLLGTGFHTIGELSIYLARIIEGEASTDQGQPAIEQPDMAQLLVPQGEVVFSYS